MGVSNVSAKSQQFMLNNLSNINSANNPNSNFKQSNSKEILEKWCELHSTRTYYSMGRVLWKRMLLKMQITYLKKTKKYKNKNAGAIIEFGKQINLMRLHSDSNNK